MHRILKSAVLSLAVAATTLTALPAAQAGDGWRHRHHHHGGGDGLVAAGVLGLAIGALAAGVATAPEREYYEPVYRDARPRPHPDRNYYIEEPDVVYLNGGIEPWTAEWYDYCESRYRSFNPGTGTFTGYDGLRHFCEAN